MAKGRPRRHSKRVRISARGYDESGRLEYFAATHLHHVGNDVRYSGKPFFLEPWQRDNIWTPVFGTGKMKHGVFMRRYRTALIGMPRDFGKTELACAMLLSEATMHPVYNGQYGIIAYSSDQAKKILKTVKLMISSDNELSEVWEIGDEEITNKDNSSAIKIFPYSEGAVQSWHFNLLIADELHVWRDAKMYNAIISGMGSVPNSLLVAITTASGERKGILWDLLNGTEDITSVWDDPEAYCWWHAVPEDVPITDRAAWRKLILPSWISVEDYERQFIKLGRTSFERYHLNRFPKRKSSAHCFTSVQLAACCRKDNDFDFGKPFALGIDGATSGDSFAIAAYQERDGVGYTHEWVFDEPDETTGHYPLGQIMELVADICMRYYPRVVGIDPNRMIIMSNQLTDVYGIDTTSFAQNNPTMCQATSLVVNLVKSRSIRLKGCRKLQDHLANTVEDDKGSYGTRFGKDEQRSKIDGAIALAIAVLGYEKLVDGQEEWSTFND
ncbi:MAG: hypothetical protein IJ111_02050 [Eggerthellaceae bacterium]|nr:hypothetical protein [Eggerthellaceae bacterium]